MKYNSMAEIEAAHAAGELVGVEYDRAVGNMNVDMTRAQLLNEAAEIIKAFGPCTIVYETKSPDELVDELMHYQEQKGGPALGDFLQVLLDVEDIVAERDGEASYREWRDLMRPGIVGRLAEIGYVVEI